MTEQTLLYCVGATKAGTSWLYRMLHDHAECTLREVKEAHYWDTFGPVMKENQVKRFRNRQHQLAKNAEQAMANGNKTRAANLTNQVAEMEDLIAVVGSDRSDDSAYWAWLSQGAGESKVVAEMTPSYALVSDDILRRMLALRPLAKVIYLVRDPLARLWSHVRMEASRAGSDDLQTAANGLMADVVRKGEGKHIVARGDYRATIQKLRRVVPADRLLVAFCETMFTQAGWDGICRFLGITATGLDNERKVHEGNSARLDEGLVADSVRFLKDQYDWVAGNVGPLPQQWQDNLARAHA